MMTWVLVRGLTREAAHWGEFPQQLERAITGTRIVAVDLPGAGRLWRRTCPLRVNDMVEPCRAQLHEQELAPPYVLLGMSLGGMVAAAWAAAHAAELAGCVFVNTSMRPFNPPQQRLRLSHWPALLSLLTARDPRQIEQTILRLTSNMAHRRSAVLANWAVIRRLRPVSNGNALRQLTAAARYRFDGPAPAAPTLVISSATDQLVDPHCSGALARHWGSEHIVHPWAGHDLPLDDGPWVIQRLAGWSERCLFKQFSR